MPVSSLAQKIATEISLLVQTGDFLPDRHLSAQQLANKFGVSRSPVREALQLLADQGIVDQRQNRGYFVGHAVASRSSESVAISGQPFETVNDYQRIAEDWLTDRIPMEVTEQMLRERYDLTKAQLSVILLRAVREGWAERKQGYGWRFLPVAKTPQAFEQIYRFRMLIEPAAMLEPGFTLDRSILKEQRRIQERMLDIDIERLPAERLLYNGAYFHEELIRMCGNPFFHVSLVRVNRMRRLMEYRSRVDRTRLVIQCQEHLEMLDRLEGGEVVEASYFMRRHLGGALERKSPIARSWARKADEIA